MYHFLIGKSSHKIIGSTSPTLRQMIQNFLYHHLDLKQSKKESAQIVVKNAIDLWKKLGIQTRDIHKIETKLIRKFDDWNHLHKWKLSNASVQKNKRKNFTSKLDKAFYVKETAQKKPARVPKRPAEHNLSENDQSTLKRKKRLLESDESIDLSTRPRLRSRTLTATSSTATSSTATSEAIADVLSETTPSDDDDDTKKSIDPDYENDHLNEARKVEFINNHVVSTIDAIGLSDYKAARILTAVAQALGHNLNDIVVSRNTIQRRRAENRETITDSLKKDYKVNWQKRVNKLCNVITSNSVLLFLLFMNFFW